MPLIDYNDSKYTEWMSSNLKQWGAHLHPLGEMRIFDFFMEPTGDIPKQRLRILGIQIQIVAYILAIAVFWRNLVVASKMTISRPRSMVSWCCLAPSISGFVSVLVVICMYLDFPVNCRITIWVFVFNIAFTMACNSLMLLQKVYLILCRQKWILYVSIPLIITQLSYAFVVIYCDIITLEEIIGCAVYYPWLSVWYWLSVNVPINALFSIIFCRIALKQYRIFGSNAWRQLARDGIQAMLLATLCTFVCSVFILKAMSNINSDLFLVVDCVAVTTILINHCQNINKNAGSAHRPRTSHMLHLSDITTARTIHVYK